MIHLVRISVDYGTAIAQRYPYDSGKSLNIRCSGRCKNWTGWHSVVLDEPPVWHDLQLTEAFLPDGDNTVNQYCKDPFGRVTVRLQCKTAAEAGISSEHNIHVYTSGTIASGQLHNGGSLKKINCEFSFFTE